MFDVRHRLAKHYLLQVSLAGYAEDSRGPFDDCVTISALGFIMVVGGVLAAIFFIFRFIFALYWHFVRGPQEARAEYARLQREEPSVDRTEPEFLLAYVRRRHLWRNLFYYFGAMAASVFGWVVITAGFFAVASEGFSEVPSASNSSSSSIGEPASPQLSAAEQVVRFEAFRSGIDWDTIPAPFRGRLVAAVEATERNRDQGCATLGILDDEAAQARAPYRPAVTNVRESKCQTTKPQSASPAPAKAQTASPVATATARTAAPTAVPTAPAASPAGAASSLTVSWNPDYPPFKDLRVRMAISQMSEVPLRWAPDSPAGASGLTSNPVEAQKLLAAAGYYNGTSYLLPITVAAPQNVPNLWAAAGKLQANLQTVVGAAAVKLVDSQQCALTGTAASSCQIRVDASAP